MEYLVNERGERTRVVLPIEEYERLLDALEDLEDIAAYDEAIENLKSGKEERIPWEQAKREIREGRVPEEE